MGVPRLPHLLGIEGLAPEAISGLLDLSESYIDQNRSIDKRRDLLAGRTVINLFFENSTRTRTSFEVAAKRLGADGQHEHPTQALLDALTIRRRRGSLQGLLVAICGDIMHSRVARSNIHLLQIMGARVRVVGPPTLMPTDIDKMGVEVHYSMRSGLKDVDIVMMLRLQTERMQGSFVPSISEYFRFFGLDHDKLKFAKPDALIMHPGPMNRGVEIDSEVADDLDRSVIHEQVEMGVAVRMACLEALIGGRRNALAGAAA